MNDRRSRIEDGRSRCDNLPSSILDPRSSVVRRPSRFDRVIEGVLDQHIVAAVSATEQAHMVGAAIDLPAPQLVVNLAANRRPQTGLAGVIAPNQYVQRFVGRPAQRRHLDVTLSYQLA